MTYCSRALRIRQAECNPEDMNVLLHELRAAKSAPKRLLPLDM